MDAFILSAVRTPIGKFLGGLAELSAPGLGGIAIAEAVKRAGIRPTQVEDVIMGNVIQAGVGQAPARQAAMAAGLPDTTPAHTTNMGESFAVIWACTPGRCRSRQYWRGNSGWSRKPVSKF